MPAASVGNEIVHGVDTFATFARIVGAQVPQDRPIGSVDQSAFFSGKPDHSAREGFQVFVADRLDRLRCAKPSNPHDY